MSTARLLPRRSIYTPVTFVPMYAQQNPLMLVINHRENARDRAVEAARRKSKSSGSRCINSARRSQASMPSSRANMDKQSLCGPWEKNKNLTLKLNSLKFLLHTPRVWHACSKATRLHLNFFRLKHEENGSRQAPLCRLIISVMLYWKLVQKFVGSCTVLITPTIQHAPCLTCHYFQIISLMHIYFIFKQFFIPWNDSCCRWSHRRSDKLLQTFDIP